MSFHVYPAKPQYEDDAAVVAAELQQLPQDVAHALSESDIRVVACRENVTDFEPSLKGVHPRNWPEGKTWDSVPGAYIPARETVVVATIEGPGGVRRVPRFGELHGSRSLAVHEVLHGLDHAGSGRLSNGKSFRAAWQADADVLGSNYYTHPDSGPEESFAESGAQAFGLDDRQRNAWPNLRDFWAAWTAAAERDNRRSDDADDRHRSIGRGIRDTDGSFVLFLAAHGENGEIGHGMVRIADGDPGFARLNLVAPTIDSSELTTESAERFFDVPPFPS